MFCFSPYFLWNKQVFLFDEIFNIQISLPWWVLKHDFSASSAWFYCKACHDDIKDETLIKKCKCKNCKCKLFVCCLKYFFSFLEESRNITEHFIWIDVTVLLDRFLRINNRLMLGIILKFYVTSRSGNSMEEENNRKKWQRMNRLKMV